MDDAPYLEWLLYLLLWLVLRIVIILRKMHLESRDIQRFDIEEICSVEDTATSLCVILIRFAN